MLRILQYPSAKANGFGSLELLLFVVVLCMSLQHRKNARVAINRGVDRLTFVKSIPVKNAVCSFGDWNYFSSLIF
jgi:hypothetical protein